MLPAAKDVYPKEAEERRLNVMRSYASAATQIDVDYVPKVSGFNPWGGQDKPNANRLEWLDNAHELAATLALEAEKKGYDAFCPYGILDIGVQAARRRGLKIPAVGQLESVTLWCSLLGRRFASCVYVSIEESNKLLHEHITGCGGGRLYTGATAIGIPNDQYPERRGEVRERFVDCVRQAKDTGAEMMGLIAMSICPTEFSPKELSDASGGFPVLDALATQIAMAESWHRTGLDPGLLRLPR